MNDVSVIIVNYNVKHFLKQCLESVVIACEGYHSEIFVVDNNSIDGSCAMIRSDFPNIKLIANKDNPGFAKANNQAIRIANSRFTLILNPDTVIEEDTIRKCIEFYSSNENIGLLGVKMIDGSGNFLPESKRGFPSASNAFWKLTGISKLFSKSAFFNGYNMGHIPMDQSTEVDVLCGAFMFGDTALIQALDGFDEAFFMYGEDIDISYRAQKKGLQNYYLPTTTIIHYKGQSTRKSELKYVKVFYQAMLIFTKKHFKDRGGRPMVLLLSLAIYLRGILSGVKRLIASLWKPILDFSILFLGFWLIQKLWAISYFKNAEYFSESPILSNIIVYTISTVLVLFLNGVYRDYYNLARLLRASLMGLISVLGVYALAPLDWRSSRAIVLIGGSGMPILLFICRLILHRIEEGRSIFNIRKNKKIALVGSEKEIKRVRQIIEHQQISERQFMSISTRGIIESTFFDGKVTDIEEIIKYESVDELIFCLKDVPISRVLNIMSNLDYPIAYKVVGDESLSIVGSKASNIHGELYTLEVDFEILKPDRKIQKRTFDIVGAIFYILLLPLLIFYNMVKGEFSLKRLISRIGQMVEVITGRRVIIAYGTNNRNHELPELKNGVFPLFYSDKWKERGKAELDKIYAMEYSVWKDVYHYFMNIKNCR